MPFDSGYVLVLLGPDLWRYHLCLAEVWADICCSVRVFCVFYCFIFILLIAVIFIFLNTKKKKKKKKKKMEAYAESNLPKLPPLGEEPKLELSKDDGENQHFREIAFITGGMIVIGYMVVR